MNQEKIKKLLLNQYFLLAVLTVFALFIRLLNIDKPSGLWYDEMLTYIVSSKTFPTGIIDTILKQDFHMPLYYFYVHFWMKIFGTNDIVLRLSSVVWGVATIPAFFYLGKEFKSEKFGYLLASIACLSPIMIYYSQEVRFYSMLMFFATISVICFIRLTEKPTRKDFLFFGLSNLVILYIYTPGIIFVSVQLGLLLVDFLVHKKNEIKHLIIYIFSFSILAIPYIVLFFIYLHQAKETLVVPFPWGRPTIFSLFNVINDLLSPSLAGIYGATVTYEKFFKTFSGVKDFIFVSITSILLVFGFFLSCLVEIGKKNEKFIRLMIILLSVLLTEAYFCFKGELAVMSRYTLIILPIILLLCLNGLDSIKQKAIKASFVGVVLIIFLYNTILYKNTPAFWFRLGGYALPIKQLNKLKVGSNDYVIYPNGTELLVKYINTTNFIDFDIPGIMYLDKTKKEAQKVFGSTLISSVNKSNSDITLEPYLLNPYPSPQLQAFVDSFIKKIPVGGRLILVDDFNQNIRQDVVEKIVRTYQNKRISKNKYKEFLFIFLYSKLYNDLYNSIKEEPHLKFVEQTSIPINPKDKKCYHWHFYIYKKIK